MRIKKFSNKTLVIIHDLFIVAFVWEFTWFARFNFSQVNSTELVSSLYLLPLVVLTQGIVNYRFYLYKGVWRFSSMSDLWNIFRAAMIGVLCITLVLFISTRLEGIPRSIFVLYPIFLIFFLGTPRLAYRYWKDSHFKNIHAKTGKRVLIVGAGSAGDMLVREMLRDDSYRPIGLIDDNQSIKNSQLHGISVLGTVNDIKKVSFEFKVEEIIIAIPSAKNEQMQNILAQCEHTELPIRTLPKLQDIVSFNSTLSNLREVTIEDLLGREKVELNWDNISKEITNKKIFISGGGGSIGSELCRQVASLNPEKLIIFESSEINLFNIHMELKKDFPKLNIYPILGNICEQASVKIAMEEYLPHIVFHAAAYKHVPMLQNQIRVAAHNNILGTKILAEQALNYKCEKFVFISTDKAVNPANVLGVTKRISEMYCEAMNNQSDTKFITVRFGNVLASAGSVVPLFKSQIKSGGPVTVTHPEITRFFMTIREASQLILQSCALGKGGEIFVLDMGEPVKITFLAEQMIKLSGRTPNKDIEIVYSGLRPGEKLYEELFYDNENRLKTEQSKILLANHSEFNIDVLKTCINDLNEAVKNCDYDKIKNIFNILVPQSTFEEI